MPSHSGQKSNIIPDEQSPLLSVEPIPDRSSYASDADNDDSKLKAQPQSKYKYLWWALICTIGTCIIAIFIKGWIDADDVDFDLTNALKRALGGGLSGAAAMVLQVILLMPVRTIMNYQYRHGTGFTVAMRTLCHDGGLRRYYQGISAALIQGPVARFGDTAANAGILALLSSNPYLAKLPSPIKTIFASGCAAAFRMMLTPIDTLKTTLQAQGARGTSLLRERIRIEGIGSLWWGAFATAAATFVGHYPWFATYNWLSQSIAEPSKQHQIFLWLLRAAFIGFCASIASDTISNSLRVIKTYRQVNDTKVSYSMLTLRPSVAEQADAKLAGEAARRVVRQDGKLGLFGRGLKTRILANGLQSILFSIFWKLFLNLWEDNTRDGKPSS